MRILHFCAHAGGFTYDWHHHHMIHELRAAGHEVIYLNPVSVIGHTADPAAYSQVLADEVKRILRNGSLDLFFATATDWMLEPAAVMDVKRQGIPTVNLSCEDYAEPFRVRHIASSFDVLWSTVRENTELLRGYGANVVAMPFAANPHIFRPVEVPEEAVVGFIGTLYGARPRNLSRLVQAGLPVAVYGKPPWEQYGSRDIRAPVVRAFQDLGAAWTRLRLSLSCESGRACVAGALKRSAIELFGRPVETRGYLRSISYRTEPGFEDIARCISGFGVNLGDIELRSTYVLREPLLFIRLREFEAPMCGGVHLVNRKPELQEYFQEDKEMLFFGNLEEMVDKARFILAPERESVRRSIRQRARARALAEHTWLHRFRRLGEILGLAF